MPREVEGASSGRAAHHLWGLRRLRHELAGELGGDLDLSPSHGRHRAGMVVGIRVEERVLQVLELDGRPLKSLPGTGRKVVVETQARRLTSNKTRCP